MPHVTDKGRRLAELEATPPAELSLGELLELNALRDDAAHDELVARLADWTLLVTFDEARSPLGHDYGSGQRRAALARADARYTDALRRVVGYSAPLEAPDDLALTDGDREAAWQRLGRPAMRRLEREEYRSRTPATRMTLMAWHRTYRRYFADRLDLAL
jgi:hypothetical protein